MAHRRVGRGFPESRNQSLETFQREVDRASAGIWKAMSGEGVELQEACNEP